MPSQEHLVGNLLTDPRDPGSALDGQAVQGSIEDCSLLIDQRVNPVQPGLLGAGRDPGHRVGIPSPVDPAGFVKAVEVC